MIQTQETEDQATISYLWLTFNSIQQLGGEETPFQRSTSKHHTRNRNTRAPTFPKETSFTANADDTFLKQGKSYLYLSSNDSDNDSTTSTPQQVPPFDSVVEDYQHTLTFRAIETFHHNPLLVTAEDSKMYQVLKTDTQLCFVLNTIATANAAAQGDMTHKRNDSDDAGITFAEFITTYKITVSCMQTLQLIPARGTSDDSDLLRKRIRTRCIHMLGMFSENAIHTHTETTRIDTNGKHDYLNRGGNGTKPAFHKVYGENDNRNKNGSERAAESQSANEIASGEMWLEELMKVKEMVAETAELKKELNLKRRGSSFVLCLSLLIFAISCSIGFYTYHQDIRSATWNTYASTYASTDSHPPAVQIPKDLWTAHLPLEKISDTLKSKMRHDLTLKLEEMEDELNLATRQVGVMVLELAKLNDELDSCQQTASTQLELQVEIEQVLQQKVNVDCIRSNLPSLASMALPTFLPIALVEKFAAIVVGTRTGRN